LSLAAAGEEGGRAHRMAFLKLTDMLKQTKTELSLVFDRKQSKLNMGIKWCWTCLFYEKGNKCFE